MDMDLIDKYYSDSLKTFIELGKIESLEKNKPRINEQNYADKVNDDSSSSSIATSSNSDLEDFAEIYIDAVPNDENVKLKSQQHVPNFDGEQNFTHLTGINNINYTDDNNIINIPSKIESIQNSSDIQIGNKTIFNGPTTFNIKQFVLPNDNDIGKLNKESIEGCYIYKFIQEET